MTRWALGAALSAAAIATVGCGGAAGRGPADADTTDIDSLLRQLEQSEQEIEAQLGPTATASPEPPRVALGGGADALDEEAEATEDEAPVVTSGESAARVSTAPPCEIACKALASMRRSADRICELAGSADARCVNARRRVDEATARVARASCSCIE